MGQILCVKKVPFRKSSHIYCTAQTEYLQVKWMPHQVCYKSNFGNYRTAQKLPFLAISGNQFKVVTFD